MAAPVDLMTMKLGDSKPPPATIDGGGTLRRQIKPASSGALSDRASLNFKWGWSEPLTVVASE